MADNKLFYGANFDITQAMLISFGGILDRTSTEPEATLATGAGFAPVAWRGRQSDSPARSEAECWVVSPFNS